MEVTELQTYITLAISVLTLSGLVFGFTPKGFPVVIKVYNWLSRNFFHKEIFGEIARLDKRITDAQSFNTQEVARLDDIISTKVEPTTTLEGDD